MSEELFILGVPSLAIMLLESVNDVLPYENYTCGKNANKENKLSCTSVDSR